MALAPKFAGLKLGEARTLHTLEIYLDYVCPFSAKLFKTFYKTVTPTINEKYASNLQVIFRQHVQPWHPSSTLTHEAGVAVLRLAPEKFWTFSEALFQEQDKYFDVNAVNEKRNETYSRLAKLGASVGVDESQMLKLLTVSDKPGPDGGLNTGNGVTNDLKLLIKANRVIGVHVSPTVFFNGIEEKSISSSFTTKEWEEWLQKNVV
ncbi:hypothetical protein AJ80_08772 [Polytolypa hystricis UAMH7299]|uniref:Uncharacterized protein n=1 Tax=Polytolypa hystricis (strain UAMH7299) TaxID=1447883 RepID=A0A2B7X2H2_POLH7|nr:hypothetical protein AJ80_08772 [Polytolypa hystricis UAMH7299]